MNFIVSASTDIGLTKDTNQDSYSVQVFTTCMGKIVLAVLCDGMGGLSKGEVASASVINAFRNWADERLPILCESGLQDQDITREWMNIVTSFNQKIKAYGDSYGISVGTTLTAMLLTQNRYHIINVGDTRAYEIVQNVRQITSDQTLVARQVELGLMDQQQAEMDPRRSVLLQCIGVLDKVIPDFYAGDLKENAVYMLCSDGFRHEVSDSEMYQCLNSGVMRDADGMKQNMDYLIDVNKQRQEKDNISVITIRTF